MIDSVIIPILCDTTVLTSRAPKRARLRVPRLPSCACAQVHVKGLNNVRIVMKTFSFEALKQKILQATQKLDQSAAKDGRRQNST